MSAEPTDASIGHRQLLWMGLQLAVVVGCLRVYAIEGEGFFRMVLVASVGSLLHAKLPMRFRLPCFVAISLVAFGCVIGIANTAWILGLTLVPLALLQLPVSFFARCVFVGMAAVALIALRAEWLQAPWSAAIWPILGSMFMFRLVVYLYDLRHGEAPRGPWAALAYFLMLPNVCFPLFPIVDAKTFGRRHYDAPVADIYQAGIHWLVVGWLHLMAYRVIYYYLAIDAADVQDVSGLAQYISTNFPLYLRISGQFHLIVGILHLFGFRLPRTHRNYFLINSFGDVWKRMNIYWRDFMMKMFFYPLAMRIRRIGHRRSVLVASFAVFVISWWLHSYQWFWIGGDFPLNQHDAVFWTVLALVVVSEQLFSGPGPTTGVISRYLRHAWQIPLTLVVFATLWSYWTATSSQQWFELWGIAGRSLIEGRGVRQLLVVIGCAGGFGLVAAALRLREERELRLSSSHGAEATLIPRRWLVPVAVLGLVIPAASGAADTGEPSGWTRFVEDVRVARLNAVDRALRNKGYYEELQRIDRLNTELWALYARREIRDELDKRVFPETVAMTKVPNLLVFDFVPGARVPFKGGVVQINRDGFRDQDYAHAKPPNTLRIAVLGASVTFGTGVNNDETYEHLLEERLRVHPIGDRRVEILNFASPGQTVMKSMFALQTKLPAFRPDIVLCVLHGPSLGPMVEGDLATAIRGGSPIPYPRVREIIRKANVAAGMDREAIATRLRPHRHALVDFSLRGIVREARGLGARPILAFLPMPRAETPAMPRRMRRIAEESGVELLDLSGTFAGYDPMQLQLSESDTHPNALGHRIIAGSFYQALGQQARLLREDARTP